ncbi:gas vesicle protein GvpK [Halococcus sediminicola]|uniref:gas vesicle protein GvpK n=1 Tax=Halococcus sediminicola TaxID=1264579 RepID=UPI0006787A44|nr:gas vesicle protein GvpK [Halococcus sediminicola]
MTTIDVDGDEARDGLMTLVVTVVELLVDAMEREAIRRMESGELTDAEIERLGSQLAALEEEIEGIKRDEGIESSVDDLRGELDGLVRDLVERADEPRQGQGGVIE